MNQEQASTAYKTTLFHNMRPVIIVLPLTIALACLVGWVALATRTPVIAFGVVLVPALVLTVLRKPIWNLFSEPATIELGVDFFSIDLSGTSFRYDFGQLNGYKVYQGVYTSQITVYPADSKERTFAFLEKSTTIRGHSAWPRHSARPRRERGHSARLLHFSWERRNFSKILAI
jgi:hypothetical protein